MFYKYTYYETFSKATFIAQSTILSDESYTDMFKQSYTTITLAYIVGVSIYFRNE